jgi:hypothetical protein
LLDKQVLENVDLSLPRMSLITGRVTDEFNDPIEGVNVYAHRSMYLNGRRQFVPTGSSRVQTDDAGQYRLLPHVRDHPRSPTRSRDRLDGAHAGHAGLRPSISGPRASGRVE